MNVVGLEEIFLHDGPENSVGLLKDNEERRQKTACGADCWHNCLAVRDIQDGAHFRKDGSDSLKDKNELSQQQTSKAESLNWLIKQPIGIPIKWWETGFCPFSVAKINEKSLISLHGGFEGGGIDHGKQTDAQKKESSEFEIGKLRKHC